MFVSKQATQKTNLCEKLSKSCFDDLAGEILFYEDQYCKENYFDDCKIIKTRSNTSNHDKDSSFDMLAEVQSNLSEEDNQTSIYVPYSKVHKLTQQGLPCSAQQPTDRCNPPPIITETVPGNASPRATLECQESGVAPTGKITNSGDWLEEFSQDLFWIAADNKGQENERSEPSPKSLKDKDCCYKQKNQHN